MISAKLPLSCEKSIGFALTLNKQNIVMSQMIERFFKVNQKFHSLAYTVIYPSLPSTFKYPVLSQFT